MRTKRINEVVREEDKEKSLIFDEGFPERVLKTSFLLSLIVITYSLSYMSFVITLSIAIGCFTSLILCKVLWWTIQHALKYKRPEIKRFFLKVSIIKYFLTGGMLCSVCLFLEINPVAMAFGLGIVVVVIVMKIGSKLLVNYLNRSINVPLER